MKYVVILAVVFTGCVTSAKFQKEQACVINQSSGFFLDRYAISANHVTQSSDDVTIVTFEGKELCGMVVARDTLNDICLIAYRDAKFWDYSIGTPTIKDKVYAISNPKMLSFSELEGNVQNVNRTDETGVTLVQIGIDVYWGSSGSPVYNGDGQLLGMIVQAVPGTRFTFMIPASKISLLIQKHKR